MSRLRKQEVIYKKQRLESESMKIIRLWQEGMKVVQGIICKVTRQRDLVLDLCRK